MRLCSVFILNTVTMFLPYFFSLQNSTKVSDYLFNLLLNHPYASHYLYFYIQTYQDPVGVFSADGEGDVVYGKCDSLSV